MLKTITAWLSVLMFSVCLSARAAEADSTPSLQEVTVTAQRVEENLQTTPVSMTALSGDFLQKFDVARVTSLETVSPNLNFFSGTGAAAPR